MDSRGEWTGEESDHSSTILGHLAEVPEVMLSNKALSCPLHCLHTKLEPQ